MKKTPNYYWLLKPIVTILLFCGLAFPAFPLPDGDQQVRVSGTIVDEASGAGMPGVNIQVKGTTVGAISDENGKFSLNAPTSNATLVFSFIGYVSQEVALGGKTTVNVAMKAELTDLDEVVVVGYSTQKRANVVGSVTSISGQSIQSIPSVSVSTAIAGRLPGSVVIQETGEPGNIGARILVRGRSTLGGDRASNANQTRPLVVIDGVMGRSMDEIDPNDIASLSVLKDASAAIYGTNAANGVILITTKNGTEGKPKLNYQFYQGFMTPTMIPDVTNAAEYATMLTEYQVANGKARTYTDDDIAKFRDHSDPWGHPDSDWYGDLIKNWTTTYRHNLTIDGGAKGMNYYVSIGMKGDESIYKQSSTNYKQYNVRAKLELPINEWLKGGIDMAGFMINREYPYKSADAIVGQSTRLLPTQWSFWPNGLPGPDIEYGDNPVVTSTFAGGKNDQKTYRMLNTFNVSITPPFVKGLAVNGSFSFDLTNYYNKAFYQPWVLYYPNKQAPIDPVTHLNVDNPLTPTLRGLSSPENNERYDRTINQTANVNVTYNKKFGDHSIALYAGYEQYTNDYNRLVGFRKYYISTLIQTMDAGADLDKNVTGYATIYARKSYIGRLTYDYKGKYLAEALYRRDGSFKFPTSKRFGNFPALLLGWRASEEGFWKDNIAFINYFKLRASYGQMGSDANVDPFQYMNKFGLSSGMVFGTGSAIETVVGPPTVANPIITWETQTTQNIGFDSKFLSDLFHLNFEYFYNKREDILAARDASVPNFTGLSLPAENIARVDNKGFEADFGVHKNIGDVRLDVSANFSHNRNEVVFKDEPERAMPWQRETGHPYGSWLMYDAIGIFADQGDIDGYAHWSGAKPGDVKFRDVSGDGIINGDDRILIENVDAPENYYGVNLDATYKNFTLTVLVQGQGKYLKFNHYDERRGEAGNYFQWTYDNRWTPDNIHTDVARAFNRNDYYWAHAVNMSTYWLDNCAYTRLKNVVLTYNIPSTLYSKLGISRASVYFSGNNLALLYTATKKFDPEVNGAGVYPAMKTFAVGANITF